MNKQLALSYLSVLTFISLFVINCEKDATGFGSGQARLNVYLTDAAAAYDSVNITFSEVSAHIDSVWILIKGDPVTVDLLEWTNGRKLLIGSAYVPAGKYTQVRILIDAAQIGVEGEVFPLTVPSGAQTGLKLGPQFTIEEGSTYDLVIDFDANRSIVATGPPHNPKSYKLKPHLRVITTAASGSISGTVTNPEHRPMAYAVLGDDTLNSSPVEKENGFFRLGFLPPAAFHVAVLDTMGRLFEQADVPVTAGADYNLGSITLE